RALPWQYTGGGIPAGLSTSTCSTRSCPAWPPTTPTRWWPRSAPRASRPDARRSPTSSRSPRPSPRPSPRSWAPRSPPPRSARPSPASSPSCSARPSPREVGPVDTGVLIAVVTSAGVVGAGATGTIVAHILGRRLRAAQIKQTEAQAEQLKVQTALVRQDIYQQLTDDLRNELARVKADLDTTANRCESPPPRKSGSAPGCWNWSPASPSWPASAKRGTGSASTWPPATPRSRSCSARSATSRCSSPLPTAPHLIGGPMEPTQTRHPWRATARTVFAAGVGALTLLPTVAVTARRRHRPGRRPKRDRRGRRHPGAGGPRRRCLAPYVRAVARRRAPAPSAGDDRTY
ncbi:hypothetical protein GA0074694_6234, partial [Micromonospora inyonensis]